MVLIGITASLFRGEGNAAPATRVPAVVLRVPRAWAIARASVRAAAQALLCRGRCAPRHVRL